MDKNTVLLKSEFIMKYHKDGTQPQNGEIFVFGSNLSGIHGAGAARAAMDHYGAKFGVGVGFTGDSYAIPTKSRGIAFTLPVEEIKEYVDAFKRASANVCGLDGKQLQYFVTRVGCGLAGYSDEDIAPLFKGCGDNCNFPEEWKPFLE